MSKETKITRTIVTTTFTVFGVNPKTEQTEIKKITLPRTYKEGVDAMKAVSKALNNEDFTVVSVKKAIVNEQLYAMDESFFIANATPVEKKSN